MTAENPQGFIIHALYDQEKGIHSFMRVVTQDVVDYDQMDDGQPWIVEGDTTSLYWKPSWKKVYSDAVFVVTSLPECSGTKQLFAPQNTGVMEINYGREITRKPGQKSIVLPHGDIMIAHRLPDTSIQLYYSFVEGKNEGYVPNINKTRKLVHLLRDLNAVASDRTPDIRRLTLQREQIKHLEHQLRQNSEMSVDDWGHKRGR